MKSNIIYLSLLLLTCVPNNQSAQEKMITITEKTVIRTLTDEGIEYSQLKRELPLSTKTLALKYAKGNFVKIIEGVEELVNVKNLLIGYGMEDYSFLEKMTNIEILVIWSPSQIPIDLAFIKKMPNLRILILDGIFVNNSIIDLTNNQRLEYVQLKDIYLNKLNVKEKSLEIIGASKNIQYFNLFFSGEIKITIDLILSLTDVKKVIINEVQYDEDFSNIRDIINKNANVIFTKNDNTIISKKYRFEEIKKIFNIE